MIRALLSANLKLVLLQI